MASTSYWMPVHDEQSARDAAKMGSLPLVIVSISLIMVFKVNLMTGTITWVSAFSAVIGVVLTGIARRIRDDRLGFVPVAVAFCVLSFASTLLLWVEFIVISQSISAGSMLLATGLIVSVLALLLSISSLRGWSWLRKNGCEIRW